MNSKLCRGKRKDNNQWIDGSAVIANSGAWIVRPHRKKGFDYIPVFPESIGQYIKKTDLHQKAICEGDIVKFFRFNSFHVGKVVFNNSNCSYEIWHETTTDSHDNNITLKLSFSNIENIEIIGNILDNSNLLS